MQNPYNDSFTPISELGEFGLINHLTKNFKTQHANTSKGIGDDAAIINCGNELIALSTDLLLEGIHFDLVYTPLQHLGYKAIIVAISDIYAMNLHPQQVFVSIGMSKKFSVEMIEDLFKGIEVACDNYKLDLAGGDTSSSLTGLSINITVTGNGKSNQVVYRSGAKENDLICVSGDVGAAYVGNQILAREKKIFMENPEIQPDLEGHDYVVGRCLRPECKPELIDFFKKSGIKPSAMIDVSDGVSSELLHIADQSNCGVKIYEDKLPIDQRAYNRAIELGLDPTMCALNGGEDYELLFTVAPEHRELLKQYDDLTIIGEIVHKKNGNKLLTRSGNEHEIIAQGWNAFGPEN
jgi:thiamine-monophosphate kinase